MDGVNTEAGVKAEWLHRKMLTTFALFSSEQKGLASYADINGAGNNYYEPKDLKSRGFEFAVSVRLSQDSKMTLGLTRPKLTGPDGQGIYECVPRTTVNLRFDTALTPTCGWA